DLWTHQGIVGWKDCPRWYNTHPEDWIRFKKRVGDLLKNQIRVQKIIFVNFFITDLYKIENLNIYYKVPFHITIRKRFLCEN
ncbi:hypothetical protein LEP1GSC124_0472, partial [Leptospira interrogans serovar Pyrogenes str. 200701872]